MPPQHTHMCGVRQVEDPVGHDEGLEDLAHVVDGEDERGRRAQHDVAGAILGFAADLGWKTEGMEGLRAGKKKKTNMDGGMEQIVDSRELQGTRLPCLSPLQRDEAPAPRTSKSGGPPTYRC